MVPLITSVLPLVGKVLDRVIPDESAREQARLQMMQMEQEGNFKELEHQLSAIIAEAQSADPWTSRARPSFMYVIYIFILAALPRGILFAFMPEVAGAVTSGVKEWLNAIPNELLTLFGVGYLGYTGARSYDKKTRAKTDSR